MSAIDWSERSTLDEQMDTEVVPYADFRACLRALARVNRWTLAARPTLSFLDRLIGASIGSTPERRGSTGRPLEVVDVGSGQGDMLRRIHAWSRRRGVEVRLTGVDLNPWSRDAAIEANRGGPEITWVTADVFAFHPERGIDVVVSSLFAHHLPDARLVQFISWMEASAKLGWFINDLHRHWLPYHFFRVAAKLAGYHRFVQHDGPISIARAFTRADWCKLLRAANVSVDEVDLDWWFPFRRTVGRVKSK